MSMATGMREAWAVFVDALRFFRRNFLVIVAFGGLASLQRFLSVGGDPRFEWAGGIGGELFTLAARVAFLAWLVRAVFRGRRPPDRAERARMGSSNARHRDMILGSVAIFLAMTIVFKIVPDTLVAGFGDAERQAGVAWILAVKNVTIIPFTMLWLTLLVRHALVPDEQPETDARHSKTGRPAI